MIYADFNGTAPLCSDVKQHLIDRLQNGPFGNPNAIHSVGTKIMSAITKCRKVCASVLGAKTNQIIFNSGASEGISHIFFSVLEQTAKRTIIISSIEHSAVINCAKYWETKGFKLIISPVTTDGLLDLSSFENHLKTNSDDLALVSIMAANNETGVIQPYQSIAKLCQRYQVAYFSDTTQIVGKDEFHFENSGMDYAVVSGHKVGALIGSGLILVKEPRTLIPHVFGGGQEFSKRGGTQNYIGIETLAIALNDFEQNKKQIELAKNARLNFERNLKNTFPQLVIVGENAPRLATTTLVAMPGIHGQAVQIELESENIFVTTSSACSDNEPTTSKVLKAMNVDDPVGRGVVRISLCIHDNTENYQRIQTVLQNIYNKLSKIESFA